MSTDWTELSDGIDYLVISKIRVLHLRGYKIEPAINDLIEENVNQSISEYI